MTDMAEAMHHPAQFPAAIPGEQRQHHPECHSPFNHDWVEEESRTRPEGGGFYLAMRCTKCNTTFKQIVNYDGTLYSGRQYTYQKDYKDPNKWSRSDWRLNFLLHLNARRR